MTGETQLSLARLGEKVRTSQLGYIMGPLLRVRNNQWCGRTCVKDEEEQRMCRMEARE